MRALSRPAIDELRYEEGVVRFWRPAPDVVASIVVGHMSQAAAQRIIYWLDVVLLNHQQVRQWHNWHEMRSFDVAAQRDLTVWHVKNRHAVRDLNIICQSQLVLMGVRVANVALGGLIQVYREPRMFEDALDVSLLPPSTLDAITQTPEITDRSGRGSTPHK
jgi:hypothetical protein